MWCTTAPHTSHLCASRITCRVRTAGISPGFLHGLGHGLDNLWLQGGGCIIVHINFPEGKKTRTASYGKADGVWKHHCTCLSIISVGANKVEVRLLLCINLHPPLGCTGGSPAARRLDLCPQGAPRSQGRVPQLAFLNSPVFLYFPVVSVKAVRLGMMGSPFFPLTLPLHFPLHWQAPWGRGAAPALQLSLVFFA